MRGVGFVVGGVESDCWTSVIIHFTLAGYVAS